jgi:hypothetical protein
MRRILLLSFLLFCACWLAAQIYPYQTLAPDRGTKTANSENTVEGCLTQSSGNYMLTDASGNVFQLVGTGGNLGQEIGQTVRITSVEATHVPSSNWVGTSQAGVYTHVSGPYILTVLSFEHVSSGCSSKR